MMFDAGSLIFNIKAAGTQVFRQELLAVDQATKQAGESSKEAGKQTEELGRKQETAKEKTRRLAQEQAEAARKARDLAQAQEHVGRALVGVGAAVVAIAALSTKAAIDWESAWAGVTKTVDENADVVGGSLGEIEDGLRGLAKELPATHGEIAAVAEAAGQLGIAAEDVVGFTKTMIDLGETTNLSSDEAATAIAQLMNIMQTAPEDVDRLGSALVELGNNGASTERDIIFMAQRIASAGKVIGLTEGEVLGFANALASAGIEVEAGGSAISRIMMDIAKSVSSNGKDLEKWAGVAGVSADQFAKKFKEKPAQAINDFILGLGRMNAAGGDVFTMLDDLGQADIRTSRALLSMANAGDLLTGSLEMQAKAWDENNALQSEAEKRYKTTEAQLGIMRNNISDAAIDFGQVFLPALVAVSEAVSDFASFMGELPEPLQGILSVVGLVTGGVLLMGGTMLLAVPKIVQFRLAMATLTAQSPKLVGSLKDIVEYISGPWTIAIAAAVLGLAALEKYLEGIQASSEEMTNALVTARTEAELFAVFGRGKEASYWRDVTGDLQNMEHMLTVVRQQNEQWWTRFSTETIGFRNAVGDAGNELGRLARSDLPAAQRAFTLYSKQVNGNEELMNELLNLMPEYRDALIEQANKQKISITTAEGEVDVQKLLKIALGESEGALDTVAEATQRKLEAEELAIQKSEEWRAEIEKQNAEFIDLGGAYDAVVQKNKDVAQATADATKSSKDSWEDYYDGMTIAINDYIAELQRQVDAQNNWESNMILLAGRVSEGMLDELASLGPEGAPLVAALVEASDEELAKLEPLYEERAAGATGKFAHTLANSRAVIEAASAQLGEGAANEIAEKLANGTATVEQIMADYKLKIESTDPKVTVDTSKADAQLAALVARWNSAPLRLSVSGGQQFTRDGRTIFEADGGKVNFYANGGRENHVAQFARAGTYRVWAEPETEGEWYIPAAKSKRARSTMILEQAANEFGYSLVPNGAQSFADGGMSGVAGSRVASPVQLTGDLYLDSGEFIGTVRGVVRSELSDVALEAEGGRTL